MKKVAFFIDGFNLYHAINELEKNHLKWLDLNKLALSFLKADEKLYEVIYFTAKMVWDKNKYSRHTEYIKALESVKVRPIVSNFKKVRKSCSTYQRSCNFHEEKQTDVAISSELLIATIEAEVDKLVIVTADSDQIPTLKAIKRINPSLVISIIAPPNRGKLSRELRNIADEHNEISAGRIEKCLFPRNVKDEFGKLVATAPNGYVRS